MVCKAKERVEVGIYVYKLISNLHMHGAWAVAEGREKPVKSLLSDNGCDQSE